MEDQFKKYGIGPSYKNNADKFEEQVNEVIALYIQSEVNLIMYNLKKEERKNWSSDKRMLYYLNNGYTMWLFLDEIKLYPKDVQEEARKRMPFPERRRIAGVIALAQVNVEKNANATYNYNKENNDVTV